jgi:urocanate hydratase
LDGGDLPGKWILTAGLGGMGGAQPLATTSDVRAARRTDLARIVDAGHLHHPPRGGFASRPA